MKMYRSILRSTIVTLLGALCAFVSSRPTPAQAQAGRAANAIWVQDSLYGTVGTPTSFQSPPPGSTDVIFSFMGGGLEGQRSVAVYAPGDQAYNGGRWNVMQVTFTNSGKDLFDPDGNGTVNFELTNADDLMEAAEMGYLTIAEAGVYFECPLLPQPRAR